MSGNIQILCNQNYGLFGTQLSYNQKIKVLWCKDHWWLAMILVADSRFLLKLRFTLRGSSRQRTKWTQRSRYQCRSFPLPLKVRLWRNFSMLADKWYKLPSYNCHSTSKLQSKSSIKTYKTYKIADSVWLCLNKCYHKASDETPILLISLH